MLASQLDPALVDSATGPWLIAAAADQDAGRSTPTHRHARGQVFGATRGLLTVSTELGQWVVPATHAVWIPPHRPHGLQTHGAFSGWSVYVTEAACAELPDAPFTLRVSALMREAVARAVAWRGNELDAAQARIAAVLLDEIRTAPHEPLGLPMPRDARLQRIARAITTDPADARSLTDWAAWAGLAPRSVSRGFVAETGFTLAAWRQRARLLKALELLAAGRAVGSIALDLGYDNVSAFIAMFRRVLGTTPGRYADG